MKRIKRQFVFFEADSLATLPAHPLFPRGVGRASTHVELEIRQIIYSPTSAPPSLLILWRLENQQANIFPLEQQQFSSALPASQPVALETWPILYSPTPAGDKPLSKDATAYLDGEFFMSNVSTPNSSASDESFDDHRDGATGVDEYDGPLGYSVKCADPPVTKRKRCPSDRQPAAGLFSLRKEAEGGEDEGDQGYIPGRRNDP